MRSVSSNRLIAIIIVMLSCELQQSESLFAPIITPWVPDIQGFIADLFSKSLDQFMTPIIGVINESPSTIWIMAFSVTGENNWFQKWTEIGAGSAYKFHLSRKNFFSDDYDTAYYVRSEDEDGRIIEFLVSDGPKVFTIDQWGAYERGENFYKLKIKDWNRPFKFPGPIIKAQSYPEWVKQQMKSQIEWHGDWGNGCDFDNSDLKSVQTMSENCWQACVNTAGCTHFTWTTYNGGTCWLKSKPYIKKEDAFYTYDKSVVCGVIENPRFWNNGCDFKGNDFADRKTEPEECGPLCAKHSDCTHFVWTTYNGGTCWLKSFENIKFSDSFKTGDNTMVCGLGV